MFLLIGASLLMAIGFLTAFLWSVKKGQFDDDYTPSVRILFDSNTKSLRKTQETEIEKKNNNLHKTKNTN